MSIYGHMLLVFNVTFNNISVLLLEETGVPLTTLMTCAFLAIDEWFYAIEHSSTELSIEHTTSTARNIDFIGGCKYNHHTFDPTHDKMYWNGYHIRKCKFWFKDFVCKEVSNCDRQSNTNIRTKCVFVLQIFENAIHQFPNDQKNKYIFLALILTILY